MVTFGKNSFATRLGLRTKGVKALRVFDKGKTAGYLHEKR
jgi:hypothetical protein